MKVRVLLSAAVTTLFAGTSSAGMLYAINDSTRDLERIDTSTLAITVVGNTGVAGGNFGDLAYDSGSGTLYWVAGRGNDSLYTIDLATGAATLVGAHGIGDTFTLGWNGSGLYGQSTSGSVYSFDTGTGAGTLIGSNTVYPGGYDYNPDSGLMVLTQAGGGALYSVDLGTGAATLLDAGAGFVDDNDIAYDADLGVYWVMDWSGNLYQYDTATYARTTMLSGLSGRYAALEYLDFSDPVPEPATLALLGLGLLGMAARRRR